MLSTEPARLRQWAAICRALSFALRSRAGEPGWQHLRDGRAGGDAVAHAKEGPGPRLQRAVTEAACVVRAAGAHHAGGCPLSPPCTVGTEDGIVYRLWRWLSVAWPLNLLLYVLTLPLAEVLWWFASRHYLRVRSATPHVVKLGPADAAIALRFYRRVARERTPEDLRLVIRRWFHGEWPSHSQVREFLGWTIYNAIDEQLSPTQAATVDALIGELRAALDLPYAEEGRGARGWMLYTRQPLAPCHKPLIFYLALQSNMRLTGVGLRRAGFVLLKAGALRYWYRPPRESYHPPRNSSGGAGPPLPIVFFHGVLGFLPYGLTLALLSELHEGAILLPVFPTWAVGAPPSVRLGPSDKPMQMPEMVASLRQMLSHAGSTRAAFLANSVGTGLLGALLERAPELAAVAVLSDPICFELSDGDVLHNFLYATPPCCGGLWPTDYIHAVQRNLVSLEPSVQFCFRRTFWWTHNYIHPAELPCETLVVLGGHDTVANPLSVRAAIERHQSAAAEAGEPARVRVEYHERWPHGGLHGDEAAQRRIITEVLTVRGD